MLDVRFVSRVNPFKGQIFVNELSLAAGNLKSDTDGSASSKTQSPLAQNATRKKGLGLVIRWPSHSLIITTRNVGSKRGQDNPSSRVQYYYYCAYLVLTKRAKTPCKNRQSGQQSIFLKSRVENL